MIPKTIHYCWFGGAPFPRRIRKCIKSWSRYCPDYQIIEWNESNFDISAMPLYVQQAYEQKKWAFVSDYARLWIIYNYGGIYLDTDVELIKNPDPLLFHKGFFGFESNDYRTVATGLGFGAEPHLPILSELMKRYHDRSFLDDDGNYDMTPNTWDNWPVFQAHGVVKSDAYQIIDDGVAIYPGEYFDPVNDYTERTMKITENTYSIHWYTMTWSGDHEKWVRKNKRRNRIVRLKQKVKQLLQYCTCKASNDASSAEERDKNAKRR